MSLQVLTSLVYENEHHLVIYNSACVAWMARPPLAFAINELPFGLSVFISFLLSVFYGYKDEPFSQYDGCYEVSYVLLCHLLRHNLLSGGVYLYNNTPAVLDTTRSLVLCARSSAPDQRF